MINRRDFVRFSGYGALALTAGCTDGLFTRKKQADRPNIVWILADDLGYGDIGCYGNEVVQTPHLDQLAQQGVRLRDFYVTSPVCSPSRGALLTGRYPQRNGLTRVIEVKDRSTHLSLDEVLISDLLRHSGYTTGAIGKWHIGEPSPAQPNSRGFDYFFGSLRGGIDFLTHQWMDGTHALYENGTPVYRPGRFITDVLGDESVKFIDQNQSRPFFLYLSFFAVHTAMGPESRNAAVQAPDRWIDYYKKAGLKDSDALYAGCTSALDEAVGKVLAKLTHLGLEENTFVFFTSDNGPDPRMPGTAWPYSGTKHQLREGGIRMPAIARWPARIPAGRTRSEPTISLDLLPTTLSAAEIKRPDDLHLDGINILPHLTSNHSLPERDLYFSYIRESYKNSREKAVRRGKWVWLNGELFDISQDPGQQKDLSGTFPQIARSLEAAWNSWVMQFPDEIKRWNDKDVKPIKDQQLRKWGMDSVNVSR